MGQQLFNLFRSLSGAGFNFWPYLVLITSPLLVFSARPHHRAAIRTGRLLLAIMCGYVFMNLALHTGRALEWKAYENCQSQFSDGAIQQHDECGEINIADGASNIFYLIFGWIPATAYTGIWEALWRFRYRKEIKEMGKDYRGKWFSNVVVGFGIFLFVIYPVSALIGGTIAILLHS